MTLTRDDLTGTLKIAGALDIDDANDLREALLDLVASEKRPRLDLGAVEACDTAAFQVLLAAQRDAAGAGRRPQIQSIPSSLSRTAASLGIALPWPLEIAAEEHTDAG